MRKPIYGVGINDSESKVFTSVGSRADRKVVWRCPYYSVWTDMLARCYNLKRLKKHRCYVGCSVDEPWLRFSIFKSWMASQDWIGKQLDKDLLIKGNRIYSQNACVFIPRELNTFLIDGLHYKGKYRAGVICHKRDNKFYARCRNPFTSKREELGSYKSEEEAHRVWAKRKSEIAHIYANNTSDQIVAEALMSRSWMEDDLV